MSNYGYPDALQQGNPQYDQYSPYQQYPPQAYPHLELPQYRPVQSNVQNPLTYGPLTGLSPQHPDAELGTSYSQDYSNVYGQIERPSVVHQQHAYMQQQQHLPPAPRISYQSNIQQHIQPQAPPLIPTPHLPIQSVATLHQIPTLKKVASRGAPAPVKDSAPATKKLKTNAKKTAIKRADLKADHVSDDEEYTMDGMKTKSGRKVHKPPQYTPAVKTASKKRGGPVKKPVVDSLFCKVCDRGQSPKSNLIVFCDGCNTPYHQLCHTPVIDDLLITLPDAEWFCATCDHRRGQRKLEMGSDGADLTEEQKKSYLAGLPTSHLVQLVLHASSKYPDLALYSPNAAAVLEKVHKKHEVAILEERAKMVPIVYLPVPGDETVQTQNRVVQIEEQVLAAAAALDRPVQNRDIMEYIESKYVIDPQSFRVQCAEQISRLVSTGQLVKEGTSVTINKQFQHSQTPGHESTSTAAGIRTAIFSAGKDAKTAVTQSQSSNIIEEEYPKVEGIKLPPEDPETDGFAMQETESPAFVHVHPNVSGTTMTDQPIPRPLEQAITEHQI
ncbi:protein of unknown function [Taphrina deformans PYCC 5710]|uniref:PHD-type domain-containing protein n=1 Tax=Taphrina deformans (strain PYCC 5710 / ATCC 11124 / CBS 356.35 / IMI 108563 / JCM 9778 / NBRC 8474) TaxID=1097556 RepID=R4XIA1_TAPDE|nr:protein of unknown function [Taphrina deformans PYCC 5710]|eukprot:CCG84224.1 protein of unknown function [Taphrina deformans PYCC 5710]